MAVTKVSDFVIERFHPVLSDVMAHGHTHYWLLVHIGVHRHAHHRLPADERGGDSPIQQHAARFRVPADTLGNRGAGARICVQVEGLAHGDRVHAHGAAHRVPGGRRPVEIEGRQVHEGVCCSRVARGGRPVRGAGHGPFHPELAPARRRPLLDLLQLQPAEDHVVVG